MRRISSWKALALSFFSAELYRDVAFSWRGVGFLYLVLLSFLSWIPLTLPICWHYSEVKKGALEGMKYNTWSMIPPFEIHGGQVTASVRQPYVVRDHKTHRVTFILDTTGRYRSLADCDSPALLTARNFYLQQGAQAQVYDLSKFPDFHFEAVNLTKWADAICLSIVPIVFTGAVLWSIFKGFFVVLFLAGFGYLMFSGSGGTLSFASVLRMASVARTPAILGVTVLEIFHITVPVEFFLCGVVELLYLNFAIQSATAIPPKTSEV